MWYIVLIAIVNLGLGFALAYHLGRGRRLGAAMPLRTLPPSPEAASFAELFDEMASQGGAEPSASSPEETGPSAAPAPEPSGEEEKGEDEQGEEENKSPSRLAIEAMQDVVQQGRQQFQEQYERLRTAVAAEDAGAIGQCVAAIAQAAREYASACAQSHATFEAFAPEAEDFQPFGKRVAEDVVTQAKAIEEAVTIFDAFDEERLDVSVKESLAKFDLLPAAADRLRDRLLEATVALARAENALEILAPSHAADPLCGLPNRLGLEIHLRDWWKKDPHRIRRLTLGAIDVDELDRVNRRWGYEAGDRLLARLAELVRTELGERGSVARVAGTRFALCATDEEADAIIRVVEQIRQTLETAQIHLGDEQIEVTASGAVTHAVAEDTSETLLERLDAAVREAKRTGRNRTFLHDGTKPTSVVPPNMTPPKAMIDLAAR